MVGVGAGALTVLGVETAYYFHRTGDLLYRLHTTENNFRVCAALFFDSSSAVFGWQDGGYLRALLKRLLYAGPRDILLSRLYLFLPALALLGMAWKAFVGRHQHLLVNLSGRGDKDIGTVADLSGAEFFCRPSCRGQSVKGAGERVQVQS